MAISSAERKSIVQEGSRREKLHSPHVWMCGDTMAIHSHLVLVRQGLGGMLLVRTVTLEKGSDRKGKNKAHCEAGETRWVINTPSNLRSWSES